MNPLDGIPPQPPNDGSVEFMAKLNAWMEQYVYPAFRRYVDLYLGYLRALGFSIEITEDRRNAGTNAFTLPPYIILTMTRAGVSVDRILSLEVARTRAPEALANGDMNDIWGYAYASSGAGNPYVAGGPIGGNPAIPPPGPATTVPTGNISSQTAQAPPNPDSGTVTSQTGGGAAPPSGQKPEDKFTFDEWNYIVNMKTGRTGPAPEDVAYDKPRETKLTFMEYLNYAAAFMNGEGEPGGSGGNGPQIDQPTPPGQVAPLAAENTLLGHLLAILFDYAGKQGA